MENLNKRCIIYENFLSLCVKKIVFLWLQIISNFLVGSDAKKFYRKSIWLNFWAILKFADWMIDPMEEVGCSRVCVNLTSFLGAKVTANTMNSGKQLSFALFLFVFFEI